MSDRRTLKIAISHVSASYIMGGSEVYAWNLCRFLRQQGHDARLVAGQCAAPAALHPNLPLELFPFRPRESFPKLGNRFRKLMERVSFGWNTRKYLARERFDILNVHKPYDLPLAAWVKKRSGCKIVWRCHGRDYFATLGHWLKHADAIYCVSNFARDDLLQHYDVPAETIYTGVDSDFFSPGAGSAPVAASVPRVLYFGRLEGWKGVMHLADAFAGLGDVPFSGRIVGDGPDYEGLKQKLSQTGLAGKVRLEPAVRTRDGVRALLAETDIVVFSAVGVETMSNAMLEAMAMGRAIVATQVGGFAEVLKHDQTALLVQPRSPSALAGGIRTLLASPERRAALGEAARRDVLERFDARVSFEKVEQLFRKLSPSP